MRTNKYAIRYDFDIENEPDGYIFKETEQKGLTDALFVISILNNDDGSYSQQTVFAYNGKTRHSMTINEIFKVWLMLGISLYDEVDLTGWRKDFVENHTKIIRQLFKSGLTE